MEESKLAMRNTAGLRVLNLPLISCVTLCPSPSVNSLVNELTVPTLLCSRDLSYRVIVRIDLVQI